MPGKNLQKQDWTGKSAHKCWDRGSNLGLIGTKREKICCANLLPPPSGHLFASFMALITLLSIRVSICFEGESCANTLQQLNVTCFCD